MARMAFVITPAAFAAFCSRPLFFSPVSHDAQPPVIFTAAFGHSTFAAICRCRRFGHAACPRPPLPRRSRLPPAFARHYFPRTPRRSAFPARAATRSIARVICAAAALSQHSFSLLNCCFAQRTAFCIARTRIAHLPRSASPARTVLLSPFAVLANNINSLRYGRRYGRVPQSLYWYIAPPRPGALSGSAGRVHFRSRFRLVGRLAPPRAWLAGGVSGARMPAVRRFYPPFAALFAGRPLGAPGGHYAGPGHPFTSVRAQSGPGSPVHSSPTPAWRRAFVGARAIIGRLPARFGPPRIPDPSTPSPQLRFYFSPVSSSTPDLLFGHFPLFRRLVSPGRSSAHLFLLRFIRRHFAGLPTFALPLL